MNRQTREYDLGELIDNPGLGLAMQYDGIDRRSLALLLEKTIRHDDRRLPPPRLDQHFAG